MKEIFISVAVAAAGGVVAWYVTQKLQPKSNTEPAKVSAAVPSDPFNGSQAPAGYFVDPNTDRLVEQAGANAATFLGQGGTVAAEIWPPGHKFQ